MSVHFTTGFVVVAEGLRYPEGPVYLDDGGFLIVEVTGGNIVHFAPSPTDPGAYTRTRTIAVGGGPNGAKPGPGGFLYVCNNGGIDSIKLGAVEVPTFPPASYTGGFIQRVSLSDGTFETWCAADSVGSVESRCHIPPMPKGTLRGPDDLIFDSTGGFWFSDWGKSTPSSRDLTGVYYVPAGSRTPIEKLQGRSSPNGIALSPDGKRLYVAETYSRWILYWNLSGPGQIADNCDWLDGGNLLTAKIPGMGQLDSMAVDEMGNLYVATLTPGGPNLAKNGGITVVSPHGEILEYIELKVGDAADPLPSNICFGGPDRKTAFITLAGTGRVVTCRTKYAGLKLAF